MRIGPEASMPQFVLMIEILASICISFHQLKILIYRDSENFVGH